MLCFCSYPARKFSFENQVPEAERQSPAIPNFICVVDSNDVIAELSCLLNS